MKSLTIMILLLASFLSSAMAEAGCLCLDQGRDHFAQDFPHSDAQETEDKDHCSHPCLQCHFVAIEAPQFLFQSYASTYEIFDELTFQYPPGVIRVLFRPPIV